MTSITWRRYRASDPMPSLRDDLRRSAEAGLCCPEGGAKPSDPPSSRAWQRDYARHALSATECVIAPGAMAACRRGRCSATTLRIRVLRCRGVGAASVCAPSPAPDLSPRSTLEGHPRARSALTRSGFVRPADASSRRTRMSVTTEGQRTPQRSGRSRSTSPRRTSRTCARASRPRAGPRRRPSTMRRRACSWRRSRRSRATGRPSTTGASARPSSTRCPTSSPRSTGWTSTSSTFAPSTRTRCRSSSATDGPAR